RARHSRAAPQCNRDDGRGGRPAIVIRPQLPETRATSMTTLSADHVTIVPPGRTYLGQQGVVYRAGCSPGTGGAAKGCMNCTPVPVGAGAKVHYHAGIETIAYLLEGECAVYFGTRLERRIDVVAGEQVFMPADVPHAPCNESGAPCTWIVVHSSGSDQD